jgi:hypothetical protein
MCPLSCPLSDLNPQFSTVARVGLWPSQRLGMLNALAALSLSGALSVLVSQGMADALVAIGVAGAGMFVAPVCCARLCPQCPQRHRLPRALIGAPASLLR